MTISSTIRTCILPVAAFALVGMLALGGVAQAHHDGAHPGAPTNLRVAAGDTEATITWDAPDAGEVCAPTDYQVWVRDANDSEAVGGNEVQSPWQATGLTAGTDYSVEVYTYGKDCDEYSEASAEATFRTTVTDGDNAADTAEKHAPKRVKRGSLTAARVGSTNSALVSWQAPGTKNGKHHAATEYAVEVMTGPKGSRTLDRTIYDITDTEVTVDNLSTGPYRFRVAAYSKECNCWGKWRGVNYAHP